MSAVVNGFSPSASVEREAQSVRDVVQVERDLLRKAVQRDPAMALLYINRMREQIASLQQIEAVSVLAEHTERLEWVDHLIQMLNSGEYPLPKSESSADSPDRTIAVGQMDSLQEINNLIGQDKIDGERWNAESNSDTIADSLRSYWIGQDEIDGESSTAASYFDAAADYLRSRLPADEAAGSVHHLIMRATGTDYDPAVYKFDQFKNMLQTRRSALSQDGTRLSTEHQYTRANIDQIKLQLSGMIDQLYGLMTQLATFG